MAIFTPGTSGTLKSTTLENALFEAIQLMLQRERDTTINPSGENRITFSLDQNLALSGNCTFPAIETINSLDGSINWNITNYLPGATFNNGGGTLKAGNLPAAIIEIAKRIQSLEVQPTKNTQNLNKINIVYDSDPSIVTLTFQADLIISGFTATGVQYAATTYLND